MASSMLELLDPLVYLGSLQELQHHLVEVEVQVEEVSCEALMAELKVQVQLQLLVHRSSPSSCLLRSPH